MPVADVARQRLEILGGFVTIVGMSFLMLLLVVSMAVHGLHHWPTARNGCIATVVVQASVAVLCFIIIELKDPGIVRRTAQTVQPMPPDVAERLSNQTPLRDEINPMDGMSNIRDGTRSYCVRCFVWREHEAPPSALHKLMRRCLRRPTEEKVHVAVRPSARFTVAGACLVYLNVNSATSRQRHCAGASLPNVPTLRALFRPPLRRPWKVHCWTWPARQHSAFLADDRYGLDFCPPRDRDLRARGI
jgi:hypothetical protein